MSRAAIRYAKAILEAAHDKGAALDVSNDMAHIAASVAGSDELKAFLVSPTASSQAKQNAVLEIFPAANDVTKSLFKLLLENKRFEMLSEIASQYNTLFEEMNGVETATVTTAVWMDAALEAKVLDK